MDSYKNTDGDQYLYLRSDNSLTVTKEIAALR